MSPAGISAVAFTCGAEDPSHATMAVAKTAQLSVEMESRIVLLMRVFMEFISFG
jgi:hypothetical protein